jgi:hypothetical protein
MKYIIIKIYKEIANLIIRYIVYYILEYNMAKKNVESRKDLKSILNNSSGKNLDSPKVSFKGFVYENTTFCSDVDCFNKRYNKLHSENVERIIASHELSAGNKNSGNCDVCGKRLDTTSYY